MVAPPTSPPAAAGSAVPPPDHAIRLFRERFFNRTDVVAILAPWGKPCPVAVTTTLDDLLRAHLLGDAAPEVPVTYKNRRGAGALKGRFRLGAYCPSTEDTTRWLCLDFDGAGHAGALDNPEAAARSGLARFAAAGLSAYLERSGSAIGFHLWSFFDPPIAADKAQALGRALAPTDAPLANGGIADPRSGRGIEVFPKQAKIRRRGYGNLVWLPWWAAAAPGGCRFYRAVDGSEGAALEPFVPEGFATADAETVERVLATIAAESPRSTSTSAAPTPHSDAVPQAPSGLPGAPSAPRPSTGSQDAPSEPASDSGAAAMPRGATVWFEWRRRALASLPLEAVYGDWLTGRCNGPGWLECRDPASASGDAHPSAGVADGSGEAERGSFHSFISGETVSVFDFLVQHGGAADFSAARARVADLSGVKLMDAVTVSDEELESSRTAFLAAQATAASTGGRGADAGARAPADGGTPRPSSEAGSSARARSDRAANDPGRAAAAAAAAGATSSGPGAPSGPSSSGSATPPPPPRRRRPEIQVNNRQLRDVVADAWTAVRAANHPPTLFARAGALVRLLPTEHGPTIDPVDEAIAFGHLARVANWVRATDQGRFDTSPPKDAARDLLAFVDPEIPIMDSIVTAPLFDARGHLIATPGYHPEARLFYHCPEGFEVPPVPERPSAAEMAAARSLLFDDLLVDFPFATPSDRAHAFAALLLPFVRRLVDAFAPIHLIEAPTPGSGKGLLSDLIAIVATGRPCEPTTVTRDEDENKKKLTALLLRAQPIILLDNIRHQLDSSQLAAMITADPWSDRLLGQTKMLSLPNRALWLATANNPKLSTEIARRCIRIRINPQEDRPWERTRFKHPGIKRWARAHRAELVHAILVLVQGWLAAGRPEGNRTLGSFESWAAVIGGILGVVGVDGFLGNTQDLYADADTEGEMWRAFVRAWFERFGSQSVAAGDLLRLCLEQSLLAEVLGDKSERSQSIRLGKALTAMRERQFLGLRIEACAQVHNQAHWRVVEAKQPAGAPTSGYPGGGTAPASAVPDLALLDDSGSES